MSDRSAGDTGLFDGSRSDVAFRQRVANASELSMLERADLRRVASWALSSSGDNMMSFAPQTQPQPFRTSDAHWRNRLRLRSKRVVCFLGRTAVVPR